MPQVQIKRALYKFSSLSTAALLALTLGLTACGGDSVKEFQEEGRKLMQEGNANGAIVFFKNALDKDSKSFELRFDLAKAYVKAGKIPQAETELEKCLLQQPNNAELLFTVAKLNTTTRKHDKALKYLDTLEKAFKPTADTRELTAINYVFTNKPAEAEQAFKDAIALAPEKTDLQVSLARLYLGQRRMQEAVTLLDSILQAHPDNVDALRSRADIAMQMDNTAMAESLYKKLIDLLPKDVTPSYALGALLLKQGKIKDAEVILENMRKNFKSSAQEFMLAGMIAFQNQDIESANTFFQQAVEKQPSIDGFYRLAITLHQLKNSESALSNLRRILDVSPSHGPALLLSGQILIEQERFEEAEREFKRFVEQYKTSAHAYHQLGTVQKALGKENDAQKSFEKALQLDPKFSQSTMELTSILLAQNHESKAVAQLEKGIEANAESSTARMALFNYYMGKHDYKKAEQVVEEGLKELPDHPLLHTLKASLQLTLRQNEQALASLQKAYALEPRFLPAVQMLLTMYMTQNKTQEALNICDAFLKHDPENTSFLVTSAIILDNLKQEAEATVRLEKALALGSDRALLSLVRRALIADDAAKAEKYLLDTLAKKPDPATRSKLAAFYLQQDALDKALAVYTAKELKETAEGLMGTFRLYASAQKIPEAINTANDIIKAFGQNPTGYILKALAQEQNADFPAAFATLENAYKLLQNPQLLVQLGELCLREKNYSKALSYFHTALLKLPKNRNALIGQGYAYLQQKDYDKAVLSYEKALELAPNDVTTLNNLATALVDENKNTERAVELATKAFAGAPENEAVVDTYALTLIANKQIVEALNVLENGLKVHPQSGQLYYRLGQAYLADSKRNEALIALQKAIKLGEFEDIDAAKKLLKEHS